MSRFDRRPTSTSDVRNNYAQQQVRAQSTSSRLDEKHVTHYVGLEVAITLNSSLPGFAQRTSDEIKAICNVRENLGTHLQKTNLGLHKKVDKRLVDRSDHGSLSDLEYNRLVQITNVAQSEEFQDAVIQYNATKLYTALRDRIQSFDVGDRERIWDGRRDRRVTN